MHVHVCVKVVRNSMDHVLAWLVYFSSNVLVTSLLHHGEAGVVCVC